MGSKVTDEQVQRGRAVERWLTGTVGLDADRARFIACNLADRSTPRVKRRALLNILQMRLDKEAALDLLARKCFILRHKLFDPVLKFLLCILFGKITERAAGAKHINAALFLRRDHIEIPCYHTLKTGPYLDLPVKHFIIGL